MKKIFTMLLAVMIVFTACKKDEDDNKDALKPTAAQKGFCLEWTSITCSICGSTGGPLLKQYSEDAPQGAMIAVHVNQSDSMKVPSATYWAFSEDRPTGGGIPSFYVGDVKTSTSDVDAVKNQINSVNAVAGVDISYTRSGNTMSIKTLTKFFDNAVGDYYLSVYVLEDGIDGGDNAPQGYDQAGGGADYKHNFVLRAEATPTMGEMIASNPSNGNTEANSYTVTLDSDWDDVYPVAVIWKHDASASVKYSYVNSIRKK